MVAVTWDAIGVGVLALVTAFVGGGLGAILATELQTRRERAEAWRSRQADAADEFASGVTVALPAIRDAYDPTFDREKLGVLIPLVDDAHSRIARVELLFGPTSDSANEARLTVGALRNAISALRRDAPDVGKARTEMYAADNHLRRFAAQAHAGMTGAPFVEPPAGQPPTERDEF